jgi:cell division protein FtsW
MIDKTLFGAVMALFTLSLIMSYTLSEYAVLYYGYPDLHFFVRQLVAIVLGIVIITGLSQLDPDRVFVPLGFALFFFSLLAMTVMPFMPETLVKSVLGAKRWIRLGPVSLAPVEFFKIGFVFFLGWSFARKMLQHEKLTLIEEAKVVFPYLLVFGLAVVLIAIFQKDLGQVVVLAITLMILFIFAGRSVRLFVSLLMVGVVAFVSLIWIAPHRIARFKSWWSTVQDTFLQFFPADMVGRFRVDASEEPYQIANSLNAIKHSDFWGQGLGAGQFKLGYLSEVHTDFILAGMTEELGYLSLVGVSLLMLLIVYRLFKIAASVENPAYYLFSVGVGLLIIFAFVVNSYGISGMTPIKGIAVPFLSYGGSQIIAGSLAIGMVLMISKRRVR